MMTRPALHLLYRQLLALCLVSVLMPLSVRAADAAPAAVNEPAPKYEEILKIDAHSHVFEDMPAFNEMLRRNNGRTINICVPGTDGLLPEMHRIALAMYKAQPDLFPFVTTFDLREWNKPGFQEKSVDWLGKAFADGALGVKIWKEIGMELKRDDGTYLMPDDPIFDPIYAFIAKQNKTLVAHLAEPIDAWLPLDPKSPHYDYYSKMPQWHVYGREGFPPHAQIIAARDHILEKHPDLTVVGAHLGSLEHDLDGLGQRFERYPNFNTDFAGRIKNLSYQSSDKVRSFFIKYQDRLVYGIDLGWRPMRGGPVSDALRKDYLRKVETRRHDDFAYLAGTGEVKYAGRTVEALHLPRSVLEKIYNQNATRLFRLKPAAAQEKAP